jgi:hypothetical protein
MKSLTAQSDDQLNVTAWAIHWNHSQPIKVNYASLLPF